MNNLSPVNILDVMNKIAQTRDIQRRNHLEEMFAEPERRNAFETSRINLENLSDTLKSQNAFRQASAFNLSNPFRINSMLSSAGKNVLEPVLLNALKTGQLNLTQYNELLKSIPPPQNNAIDNTGVANANNAPQNNEMGNTGVANANNAPQNNEIGNTGTANVNNAPQNNEKNSSNNQSNSGYNNYINKKIFNIPLSEEDLNNYYRALRIKASIPTFVQQKLAFAANIEKTIKSFGDANFINRYSGSGGSARLLYDKQYAAFTKKPSKDFIEYNNFINTELPLLVSQVRQFYGDSIQPDLRKELEGMIHSSSWYNNPELAFSQLNKFIDLVRNEAQTYNTFLKKGAVSTEEALQEPNKTKSNIGGNLYNAQEPPKNQKTYPQPVSFKSATNSNTIPQPSIFKNATNANTVSNTGTVSGEKVTKASAKGGDFKSAIKDLVESGKLTEDYYKALPTEQRKAILEYMKSNKHNPVSNVGSDKEKSVTKAYTKDSNFKNLIESLVNSGKLTEDYYKALPTDQRKAILEYMKSRNANTVSNLGSYKGKPAIKTYTQNIGFKNAIKDLVDSGKLTEARYKSLPTEQRKVVLEYMKSKKAG